MERVGVGNVPLLLDVGCRCGGVSEVKKPLRNEKFKCMHAACALAPVMDFGRLSLSVTRVVPGDARQNEQKNRNRDTE